MKHSEAQDIANCDEREELTEDEIFALDPQPDEPITQASRIVAKFGGARRLAAVLKAIGRPRDPASIYKWNYPRSKGGSEGMIPTSALPDVLAAARAEGLLITPEDMDPRDPFKRKPRPPRKKGTRKYVMVNRKPKAKKEGGK